MGISTLSTNQSRPTIDSTQQRSATIKTQQLCSSIPMAKPAVRTELFFGLRKPNGTEVNHAEFQQFLDREVTPRFPDGFTLLSGQGQFKNASGVILKEQTKLLILLYPIAATSSQQIEQIRNAYITAFQQQSVLRADELACSSF